MIFSIVNRLHPCQDVIKIPKQILKNHTIEKLELYFHYNKKKLIPSPIIIFVHNDNNNVIFLYLAMC